MAPIAGRHYAALDGSSENAIVADTGGTSYDVSARAPRADPGHARDLAGPRATRGTSPGSRRSTCAASARAAARSRGSTPAACCTSGPQSAGADPGPVCYGRGGTQPTVTDACVVLGYIDPDYFLGGEMALDAAGSRAAIAEHVAEPLGLDVDEAAAAIMAVATERMVQAIEEITVNQGVDPRTAVLVGGGGAAGLNAVAIARRLGSRRVVIPQAGAVLSARGALMSDLTSRVRGGAVHGLRRFRPRRGAGRARRAARALRAVRRAQRRGAGRRRSSSSPRRATAIRCGSSTCGCARDDWRSAQDVAFLVEDFHSIHEEVFAVRDERAVVEVVNLRARVNCPLQGGVEDAVALAQGHSSSGMRSVYFSGIGAVNAAILRLEAMSPGAQFAGPAIVESSFTTIVLDPGASAERTASGSLAIAPGGLESASPAAEQTTKAGG